MITLDSSRHITVLTLLRVRPDSEQPLKSLAFTEVTCSAAQYSTALLSALRMPHTTHRNWLPSVLP